MLSRAERLRTKEVAEVLRKGRGLPSGHYLSAKMLRPALATGATMRCAAVVSKKVAKSAAERNRLRRALYEAVRAVGRRRQAEGGVPIHIVFFIRSIPAENSEEAFAQDVEGIFSSLSPKP